MRRSESVRGPAYRRGAGCADPAGGLLGDETMIGVLLFVAFVVGVGVGAVGVLLYVEGL